MATHPARTLSLLILFTAASDQLLSAQCPDGSAPPCGARPAQVPAATSLALLYFESQSPDTNDDYLADGITEEV